MKEPIGLVLFDLDGVLVDATDLHYKAFNAALICTGNLPISLKEHLIRFNGLPSREKLNLLANESRIHSSYIEQVNRIKQDITKILIDEYIVKDESKLDLLRNLKLNNVRASCVTNCSYQTAQLMLRKAELIEYLDFLITNEDVKESKPSPEGYIKAIDKYHGGFGSYNTLIIEDSDKGAEAARRSGAKFIQVAGPHEVTWEHIRSLL